MSVQPRLLRERLSLRFVSSGRVGGLKLIRRMEKMQSIAEIEDEHVESVKEFGPLQGGRGFYILYRQLPGQTLMDLMTTALDR